MKGSIKRLDVVFEDIQDTGDELVGEEAIDRPALDPRLHGLTMTGQPNASATRAGNSFSQVTAAPRGTPRRTTATARPVRRSGRRVLFVTRFVHANGPKPARRSRRTRIRPDRAGPGRIRPRRTCRAAPGRRRRRGRGAVEREQHSRRPEAWTPEPRCERHLGQPVNSVGPPPLKASLCRDRRPIHSDWRDRCSIGSVRTRRVEGVEHLSPLTIGHVCSSERPPNSTASVRDGCPVMTHPWMS